VYATCQLNLTYIRILSINLAKIVYTRKRLCCISDRRTW